MSTSSVLVLREGRWRCHRTVGCRPDCRRDLISATCLLRPSLLVHERRTTRRTSTLRAGARSVALGTRSPVLPNSHLRAHGASRGPHRAVESRAAVTPQIVSPATSKTTGVRAVGDFGLRRSAGSSAPRGRPLIQQVAEARRNRSTRRDSPRVPADVQGVTTGMMSEPDANSSRAQPPRGRGVGAVPPPLRPLAAPLRARSRRVELAARERHCPVCERSCAERLVSTLGFTGLFEQRHETAAPTQTAGNGGPSNTGEACGGPRGASGSGAEARLECGRTVRGRCPRRSGSSVARCVATGPADSGRGMIWG